MSGMNTSYTDVIKACGPSQVVAYTGTAGTIANVIPPGAAGVWVFCTSIAYVKVGASPTATVADIPVPASWPILIPIENNKGDLKVSAVQSAAGGNLHVQPVASC
jgi:hypothetical protein